MLKNLDDAGISEAQGTLFLLAIVIIAVILVRTTVGDSMIAGALDIGKFRVWGGHNPIDNINGTAPGIIISSPADGSKFYIDQDIGISGRVISGEGRHPSFVYYRVNEGPWLKSELTGNIWSGICQRYPEGEYRIEAIAYDDAGDESQPAYSRFLSLFRLYPDALFIEDDIPGTMTAGDTYDVHVRYLNNGYLPWNNSAGYRLCPLDPNPFSIAPLGFYAYEQVKPSSYKTFNISLLAPKATGSHDIILRMKSNGYGWFGQQFSKTVNILESIHDAKVVSMDMPSSMVSGESRTVSITVQNTGTAAWYNSGNNPVRLGMVGDTSGDAYLFNKTSDRIYMAPGSVVRSGNNYVFTFKITAPAPGTYQPEYRMVWENKAWFGETASCTIRVVSPTPTPRPPAPTPDPYQAYIAWGTMRLIERNGNMYNGCIPFVYDGPLCKHYTRASYYERWDIGGPNGHYRIYSDRYSGGMGFDMNNGGNKGTVTFFDN